MESRPGGPRGWFPVEVGPTAPQPESWLASTDGSGDVSAGDEEAGWGAVIFRVPIQGLEPDYVLHGPVLTAHWDHRWVGARECTNNTGELSAMAEIMLWLLYEAPDDGRRPVELRYDSEYAANVARGIWEVQNNEELAAHTRMLTRSKPGAR